MTPKLRNGSRDPGNAYWGTVIVTTKANTSYGTSFEFSTFSRSIDIQE